MAQPEVHDLDFDPESRRRVDDDGGIDQGQLDFDIETGRRVDDDGGMRRRVDSGPGLGPRFPPWLASLWHLRILGSYGDAERGRRDGGSRRRRRAASPVGTIRENDDIEEIDDDDEGDRDAERARHDGGRRRRRIAESGLDLFAFGPIGFVPAGGLFSDGAARARRFRLVPHRVPRRVWLVLDDDGGDGNAESVGRVDDEGGMTRADPGPGSGWRDMFRRWLSELVRQVNDHPIIFGSTFTIILESGKLLFQVKSCSLIDSNSSKFEYIVVGGYVVAACVTAVGLVLHLSSRSRRYSSFLIKAGALGCVLAVIEPYARFLPPWMGWSGGAACSIMVAIFLVFYS